MDKKQKKRTQVLLDRVQHLRQQLAGAKKQMDDASEVESLQKQLATAEAELQKLRDS